MITNERLKGITAALSKAGLAEGTNAACIKTNAPNGAGTDFAINGYAYHKADTDNIAMTALAVQAADTTCLYGVWIDSAGTVSMTKSTEVASAAVGVSAVLKLPDDVADKCLLGLMKVVTVAVTFTNGTTDLSAAGITATFYDVAGGPTRPRNS
jgi:hypothetical protein